jgi:hypothetical protein
MDGKVRVRLAHIQKATSGCKADSITKNLKLNVSSNISTVNRTGTMKTLEEFFLIFFEKLRGQPHCMGLFFTQPVPETDFAPTPFCTGVYV